MANFKEEALNIHRQKQGKLEIRTKLPIRDKKDLSLAYSPGVAEPCKEIYAKPETIYDYTMKGNMVGVVSNGTAVLGLGDIGAAASLPVMEGKSVLLKRFAGVDSFPICLDTRDVDQVVQSVRHMAVNFGGINLEDIAAPACFQIEDQLKQELDIPVFHDDQHGTAIVTLAGLMNALQLVGKELSNIRVVANGAGAAGIAIVRLLLSLGVNDIVMCDSKGIIYEGRTVGMNAIKEKVARKTNPRNLQGTLADAVCGADVFIGISVAGTLTPEMVQSMNSDPIIFAMANPEPEIMPEIAKQAGAKVVGTGRSDFPNQVNNVLAFPGIFRGALDVRASEINEEMKIAAVYAIADLIEEHELHSEYVIPGPFDERVAPRVAAEVAKAAMKSGVARIEVDPAEIERKTLAITSTSAVPF